jgi:hypothetical protein
VPKINEFTDAILSVKDEISVLRKIATKADPIPFMQERVSKRQYVRDRFERMSPEQRRQYIEKNGPEALLQAIGGKQPQAPQQPQVPQQAPIPGGGAPMGGAQGGLNG